MITLGTIILASACEPASPAATEQSASSTPAIAGLVPVPAHELPLPPTKGCLLPPVPWFQAKGSIGAVATVGGPVVSGRYYPDREGKPTILNLGNDENDPNRLIVVIWGESRDRFPKPPEEYYADRIICVYGYLDTLNGIPLMRVDSPGQVS